MNINYILLLVSLIVIFGYIAEWVFKRANVPDVLFLIILGFIIGPNVLKLVEPESLGTLAPLFTTFTLVFLMFEGALSIDLKSFAEGIAPGITIGFFNFFLSTAAITAIFYFQTNDLVVSLMLGFSLGGVTSAFIIPIIKQLDIEKKIYSILTLESAFTDVLAIVLAITMMEIKILKVINIQNVLSRISSLFAVAGIVGLLAGSLWVFLEFKGKLVERDKNYLMTVAYLLLAYFITEYLGGNGAISALFVGISLANSDILIFIGRRIIRGRRRRVPAEQKGEKSVEKIVSRQERTFYNEISFFLKTFFFVYVGLLLNVSNMKVIGIGSAVALSLMALRGSTWLITRRFDRGDRMLMNSLFARGIAPVAIILMAMEKRIVGDQTITDTVYFIITATILLSSLRVFVYRLKKKKTGTLEQK